MPDYTAGKTVTRTKTFTDDDVQGFARISGDSNPVHLDDEYASQSMFGQRIVHGMLSASLISALIANDFPGPGSIYLGQNLKFKKPVFIGDTLTASVTVKAYRTDRRILTLETRCTNQDGVIVIEGEATVIAPAD